MALRAAQGLPDGVPPEHRAPRRRAGRRALERRPICRRSRRWCRSSRSRIRRAWSTRSTCSSRSTSATWSRRCCSTTSRRRCGGGRSARSARSRRDIATQWLPQVRRMLERSGLRRARRGDRGASARSTTRTRRRCRGRCSPIPIRGFAVTAAVALAASQRAGRRRRRRGGAARPRRRRARTRPREARRDVAAAVRHIGDPRFRRLLIPLALRPGAGGRRRGDGERARGRARPTSSSCRRWSSLLRNRRLKGARAPGARRLRRTGRRRARAFHARPRGRHLGPPPHPGDAGADSVAEVGRRARRRRSRRPTASCATRSSPRSNGCAATDAPLDVPAETLEALALREGRQYFNYLSLHDNLFGSEQLPARSLLAQALDEKMARIAGPHLPPARADLSVARHRRGAVDAARTATRAAAPARPSTSTTSSTGQLRKRIMPVLEDLPLDEKVRRGNVAAQDAPARRRGNAAAADQRRRPGGRRGRDRRRARAAAVDARRRRRARARASRSRSDWYVFEAASWALAERRMPASNGGASSGSSRCRRRRSRRAFARCRSSRRSASTSCSGSRTHRAGAPRAGRGAAAGRHGARHHARAARRTVTATRRAAPSRARSTRRRRSGSSRRCRGRRCARRSARPRRRSRWR